MQVNKQTLNDSIQNFCDDILSKSGGLINKDDSGYSEESRNLEQSLKVMSTNYKSIRHDGCLLAPKSWFQTSMLTNICRFHNLEV